MNTAEATYKYSESFNIKTFDVDFNRQVKPSVILSYMQELATAHAEILGLGYKDSMDHGFFWVLGRLKYDMKRMPQLGEKVTLKTWPVGIDGITTLRRFDIFVGEELVGQAFNYWLMVSTDKGRPVKPDYFFEVTKDLPVYEEDRFTLKKRSLPKDMTESFARVMRNSDLDWNDHVNNVRYAGLVYDAIPHEILREKRVLSLQINYLKEIKVGDEVVVSTSHNGDEWSLAGHVNGKLMFSATAVVV